MFNNKLYFKYILNNFKFFFINNLAQKNKSTDLFIHNNIFLFLTTHFKLSSIFYTTSLCDIFSYEHQNNKINYISNNNIFNNNKTKNYSSILVYNFHLLSTEDRFFIFLDNNSSILSKKLNKDSTLNSISELFPSANWLEREVSELNGIVFFGKKDLRNLMLQYGDSSTPFKKSFPSIGLKEIYYDSIKDTIIQNPITLQL